MAKRNIAKELIQSLEEVSAHNFRQKRDRIMREIREAHTSIIWHLPRTDARGKRSRTLAARRLMERSRDLWKLFNG